MLAILEKLPLCNDLGDEYLQQAVYTLDQFRADKNRKHEFRDADQNFVAYKLGDYIYDTGELPRAWSKNTWYDGSPYEYKEVVNALAELWQYTSAFEIIQHSCAWPLTVDDLSSNKYFEGMVETNLRHFMSTGQLPSAALDAFKALR